MGNVYLFSAFLEQNQPSLTHLFRHHLQILTLCLTVREAFIDQNSPHAHTDARFSVIPGLCSLPAMLVHVLANADGENKLRVDNVFAHITCCLRLFGLL